MKGEDIFTRGQNTLLKIVLFFRKEDGTILLANTKKKGYYITGNEAKRRENMYACVMGSNIHYDIVGSGKTILLLHGWGAPFQIYQKLTGTLAEHYRMILLDFPGFGQSDEPAEAWNVSDYADFVLEFLKEIKEQPEILLVHSFGGRVAIKLLSEKKEKCEFVKKAVFMDAAGVKNKKGIRQRYKEATYKLAKKVYSIPIVSKMYPDLLDEMRAKRGSSDYQNASPVMRQILVKAVNEDQTGELHRIPVPVLLLWGDKDTATPLYQAKVMEREIESTELVVLEGASHFSFLEQTPEAVAAIEAFL